MQLTIEVLPAPLGPIIENSSPSFTPKLTSLSARTPPKRSETPRTSKACSTHSLPRAVSGERKSVAIRKCPRPTAFGAGSAPSPAVSAARQGELTMVRLFNILDYWAQLSQRSLALLEFSDTAVNHAIAPVGP